MYLFVNQKYHIQHFALSFYYNRPQWKNDPMGEGPVLRALVEMIDAPAYTEIKAEQQYDKIK